MFHVVWLDPYLVSEIFGNNSVQLTTFNGEKFPIRTSCSKCKKYRT